MISYNKIIDISLPLSPATIIYPGNPRVEIETIKSESGTNSLSKISFGSHTGTHVDAPSHAILNGATIDQFPLNNFIGPCRILDLTHVEQGITVADLQSKNIQKGERILFKTKNSLRGFDTFYDDFVYLTSEGAIYLAELGVTLVGIDSLSIKERGSKDNRPHTTLLSKNVPIVEGINLKEVNEGNYFFICLPLNFIGLDGSPARALLLQ